MLNDLLQAALFLLPIGAGVALLVILGRDRTADEHDLTDYHEPIPEPELDGLKRRIIAGLKHGRPVVLAPTMTVTERDILPPAPAGMDAGSPLWRQLVIDQAVPTLPDAAVRGIADDWLRELGEQARAQLAAAR